ncbi:uncharacterized protein LOC114461880 [Gouania willdenowi]|uniref:uncharacterized protein LOC114461880 n=1 Tax=Gouania willdenowi TaxID=441366 RepID=UPI0010567313|nr:uncharacterized protein LOC114461880 [Gouania willdenowi]
MFSDSGAPAPGEQKGFKPHTPHFLPWLRNSLKSHQTSDLGLNGPFKPTSEGRNSLAPLEKAKSIGFFSIQGKDRAKKGELRCNGVGMARMLPVVLRGHQILPGTLVKQKEGSPSRWNQTNELDSDLTTQTSQEDVPKDQGDSSSNAEDNHSIGNHSSHRSLRHSQTDGNSTAVRNYRPPVGPPPTPVSGLLPEECDYKEPVEMCIEDKREKVWDNATSYHQRELHSSSWLGSDAQERTEKLHGFSSSFTYINKHSRNSQSQRDLTSLREPLVQALNGPLSKVIFSTEVPHRGLGSTATLHRPKKPRPSSERIEIRDQSVKWVPHRVISDGETQRKPAGCSRKMVRNQIKNVMDNLEQVLKALRDVHQEMREVVQQIDYLTSTIDLNEEEECGPGGVCTKPPNDSSYSSGCSQMTVGSTNHELSESRHQPAPMDLCGTLRRDRHPRSQSPVQLFPVTSGILSERSRTLRFTCSLRSPPAQSGPLMYTNILSSSEQPPNINCQEISHSPQKNVPVRPPTPGLSPLTVNLQHPGSPGSQPQSPGASSSARISPESPPSPLSPKLHPTSPRRPSMLIETRVGFYQSPRSDFPSDSPFFPSLTQPSSASCPPIDSETQTVSVADREGRSSSAGPSHVTSSVTAKAPAGQGRRGRKPPPYPHHRLSEQSKKTKEPRKAPPYPEKRRLLSTTV